MSKLTGSVKWFNSTKGFGFITPSNGGKDLFVHFSGIVGDNYRTLEEGARVEFNVQDSQRGPAAVDVVVL
ncbi:MULTISPECIES: cold-shock protein [Testudinibacter]|uniref:Cold shock domain-containing protein n=1 Tax=Testudinibacter aquarius TaxID=1524974 RepID=A0A4R3XWV4_9PAST|nr:MULTISPECIES: cold shock domain-containing protein [Testudinibacter]TNG91903.1 cold shock domain-containing protein [Pasteurellaceae bacterium USgator41]TNG94216.1 cold shock domain-containing protein [Pasteurellaceae bacterium UScroc12]TNG98622.1 cold shock domain-containing protein [Pasteurellaceae bacterium UScroc31]TNH00361.1 cold shock domain-containing protein [Pasteurellaceae bacterium Phil31]TNH01255.1 cold shock domain-containing protein [Pasteurellaceae bacterium USgator11]TNH070